MEWARDKFSKIYSARIAALNAYAKQTGQTLDSKQAAAFVKLIERRPKTFEDCLVFALMKFYKYFRNDPLQLLHTYPADLLMKNGTPFWKLPKRRPTPI
jgi:hypothetical protein